MLKSLHIENIAVIEKTDIDFDPAFNCLTGETGAGKSIIIDAINAVLGERASKDLIRTGCERASVSAVFCGVSPGTAGVLLSLGYEPDEEGRILITRTITKEGSAVRINGRPATLAVLREVSKFLVNIHGQHDSQRLLDPVNHITYIDKLAAAEALKAEYYEEFHELNRIRKELAALETDEGEKQRKTELLKYQINEIESAALTVGETDKLRARLKSAEEHEKISAALYAALNALEGTEDTDGALSLVKNAQKELVRVEADGLDEAKNTLAETLASLENAASDIKKVSQNAAVDLQDAEKIRARLDTLRPLVLKYGGTEEKALAFLENCKAELETIVTSDKRIKELSALLDSSTERLVQKAAKLTAARSSAAKIFEKQVTEKLAYLNMAGARFGVSLTQGKYTKNGCDIAEFMILTNAGDTMKPLAKIASGGELSRIMLAVKSVLADKDDVDTLIFDEIDSGISGRAAGKVGVLLKAVSGARQVICVTHLAQIAAYADNHLLIEKSTSGGTTQTAVTALSYDQRIGEIARIMSGTEITDNLYKSAKELLDRSR